MSAAPPTQTHFFGGNTGGMNMNMAAKLGDCDRIRQLAEINPEFVTRANSQDWTPIQRAVSTGQIEAIKLLIELGADSKKKDKKNRTLVLVAAQYNQQETISFLHQELGISVDEPMARGMSPVYIAAQKGHDVCILRLAELGADVNQCSKRGTSPAWIASYFGNKAAIRQLAQSGADLTKANVNDYTPLRIAKEQGHDDFVTLLETLVTAQEEAKAEAKAEAEAEAQAKDEAEAEALARLQLQQAEAEAEEELEDFADLDKGEEGADDEPPEGLLKLNVLKASHLDNVDGDGELNDVYVEIHFADQDVRTTSVQENAGAVAQWPQSFDVELNGVDEIFLARVFDRNKIARDTLIGDVRVNINEVIRSGDEPYWVDIYNHHQKSGRLCFSSSFIDTSMHRGQLKMIVREGQNLRDCEAFGKNDPYLKVYVEGGQTRQTKTIKDAGANPKWEEEFVIVLTGTEQTLELVVLDEDRGKDDKIGGVRLNIRDIREGKVPQWVVLGLPDGDDWVKSGGVGKINVEFIWTPFRNEE